MSEDLLKKVEPTRRGFLRGLVGAAAFATPMLVSFRMGSLGSSAGADLLSTKKLIASNQTRLTNYYVDGVKDKMTGFQLETGNLFVGPMKDAYAPLVRGPILSNMVGYTKLSPGKVFEVKSDGTKPLALDDGRIIVHNQVSGSCATLRSTTDSTTKKGIYIQVRAADGSLRFLPVFLDACSHL